MTRLYFIAELSRRALDGVIVASRFIRAAGTTKTSCMIHRKAWFQIKYVLYMYGQFTVRREFDASGLGGPWKSTFRRHEVTLYPVSRTRLLETELSSNLKHYSSIRIWPIQYESDP